MTKITVIILSGALLLSGCMADIRNSFVKSEGLTNQNISKGKEILNRAWQNHGYDKITEHEVYSFTAKDTWKGMMGRMGKPWPNAKSNMAFKYEIGTFNSQVTYLDGKQKGITSGLQSWNYYESKDGKLETMKMNKRRRFGLSAYHYFFEMLDRLKKVPLITYAGEKKFKGQDYDIIFATWDKLEPHKENDQYKLYINKKTGMLDYAIYSLRENYLKFPGSVAFYGSVKYEDYRLIDGIYIPHIQTVFLNKPKKNDKKHVHKLIIKDFKFDDFAPEILKPISNIAETGDSKAKG